MRERKAQVSMEFLFLVILGFVLLVVFLVVAREQIVDVADKKQGVLLNDVAFMVQTELNSAQGLENGYERIFVLPDMLDGQYGYSVRIEGNYVIANISDKNVIARIQKVNGNLQLGNNTIRKTGGVVYLN